VVQEKGEAEVTKLASPEGNDEAGDILILRRHFDIRHNYKGLLEYMERAFIITVA